MNVSTYTPPVSCHLITWGSDFRTGLREASALGYTACETFTDVALSYADEPNAFRDLLAEHGFQLSALYGGGRFSDPGKRDDVIAYNERVARLLADLGVEHIVFGPAGPRNPQGTSLDALKQAAQTINAAAQRCFDLGVRACIHPHLRTEIQDENEIDTIMQMTDPNVVFLAPDTAHLHKAGMDPVAIMQRYAERIAYVHLKDVMPESPDLSQFSAFTGTEALPIFCELGLGPVDFEAVIDLLRSIDYDGWLTVEIDRSTSTPKQSLEICRDYLENVLGIPV